MSTVEIAFPPMKLPLMAAVLLASGFLLGWLPTAEAHPVSQGSMEVTIFPERIELRARVSTEEVFVRRAFSPDVPAPANLEEAWQDHGRYMLQHVRVFADGKLLPGRVAQVAGPPTDAAAAKLPGSDRLTCELVYPLNPDAHPGAVRVEEDVLNEFNYAPGNCWEASYVVRIGQEGKIFSEGRLLTSKDPLDFRCDWAAGGASGQQQAAADNHAGLDRWRLVREYVHHGVMHILTGYDHLLFISALALATITLWDLVKVISAFTLAHTITLTVATLGIFRLPEHIVEPMISASIVFVALQNVLWPRQSRGMSRLAAAFFFGLFHGLGFAGGLMEAMEGLPGMALWLAIAAFSLGVELGHQSVVLPVFFGLKWARSNQPDAAGQAWVSKLAMRYGSSLIVLAGTYYLVVALHGG
jgi:hydrogenase/urease accessory protein HupE